MWRGAAPTDTIPTGADWAAGLYVVRLDDAAPTAWFVVRGGGAIVLELATNTWNAYNDVDGPNLYTGAVELSFARPLAPGMLAKDDATPRLVERGYGRSTARPGADDVARHGRLGRARSGGSCAGPRPSGIALGYATNADLEQHPDVLDGCRLLLSVGHDEYWTWGMRDTVEALRRRRRQRRVPVRQHVLLAGAHRGRRDGRLQAPLRRGPGAVARARRRCGRTRSPGAGDRR